MVIGKLADVDHSIATRKNLDESSERHGLNDLAGVNLAHFNGSGEVPNHLNRQLRGLAVGRADDHRTVVLDVHSRLGGLHDPADGLSARADDRTDLVHRNVDGLHPGGVGAEVFANVFDGVVYHIKNLESTLFGLLQRVSDDVIADAVDFDVQLYGSDALAGACHLEVHVSDVIL